MWCCAFVRNRGDTDLKKTNKTSVNQQANSFLLIYKDKIHRHALLQKQTVKSPVCNERKRQFSLFCSQSGKKVMINSFVCLQNTNVSFHEQHGAIGSMFGYFHLFVGIKEALASNCWCLEN